MAATRQVQDAEGEEAPASRPPAAEDEQEATDDDDDDGIGRHAPASPTGEPPALTDRQRNCLSQLLQEHDDQGRPPCNLDQYHTGEEKWRA